MSNRKQTPEEKAVERVARELDPQSWGIYDRFARWEEQFGHKMPSDGMDKLISASRLQAIKVIRAFLPYMEQRVLDLANHLHEEDHNETLTHHLEVCERENCDREETYMQLGRDTYFIAQVGVV